MNIETKADFAVILRDCLPQGTTLQEAEALARAYATAVHQALAKGAAVIRLPAIGAITCTVKPPRKIRHPRTGEPMDTAEKRKVKITPHTFIKRLASEAKTK